MSRQLVLLALTLAVVGCNRPTYRAQGPFAKRRATPTPAALPDAPPALNIPGDPVPMPPAPPAPPAPGAGALTAPNPGVNTPGSPREEVNPGVDTPGSPKMNPNLDALKAVARTAVDKWKTVDTYEASLTTREIAGNNPQRTEEMLLRFRKEPFSVYMRNVGAAGKGREVLYNPRQFEDKIHAIVGEGDSRLVRAGSKAPSLTPDSPMVRSKSRHSIREAGFGFSIDKFAGLVGKVEGGKLPADALRSLGTVTRTEFGAKPLAAVEQTVRPGDEPALEKGGTRQWYFDADPASQGYGLPVLVILHENTKAAAREVEYYCFTNIKCPAGLGDADFDPAKLGKMK